MAGDENVADILKKNVKAEVLERHMAEMGFTRRNPAQRGSQNTSEEQISRLERCTDRAATAEAGAAAGAAATPTVKRSHGTGDDGRATCPRRTSSRESPTSNPNDKEIREVIKIADPDLDDGDNVYKQENFDLWQVKGGAMLDNVWRSGYVSSDLSARIADNGKPQRVRRGDDGEASGPNKST